MPNSPNILELGVFESLEEANQAVENLIVAGFSRNQIVVFCQDNLKDQQSLDRFREPDPQSEDASATLAGSAIGATLGGLAAVAGAVATGGAALLAAGGLGLWAGGVTGGLLGAMSQRGVEDAAADFYDQAVADGNVLVAVESEGDPPLDKAASVLESAGAATAPIPGE